MKSRFCEIADFAKRNVMSFPIIAVVRQLKYRVKIDNNKFHAKYDNARRTLIYSRTWHHDNEINDDYDTRANPPSFGESIYVTRYESTTATQPALSKSGPSESAVISLRFSVNMAG